VPAALPRPATEPQRHTPFAACRRFSAALPSLPAISPSHPPPAAPARPSCSLPGVSNVGPRSPLPRLLDALQRDAGVWCGVMLVCAFFGGGAAVLL
jgi:hypothetical protein